MQSFIHENFFFKLLFSVFIEEFKHMLNTNYEQKKNVHHKKLQALNFIYERFNLREN